MAAHIDKSQQPTAYHQPDEGVGTGLRQFKTPHALYGYALSFLDADDKHTANSVFARVLRNCDPVLHDFLPKPKTIFSRETLAKTLCCTYLNPRDLANLAPISHQWKSISEHPLLWNAGPIPRLFMGKTGPKQTWLRVNSFYLRDLAHLRKLEADIKNKGQEIKQALAEAVAKAADKAALEKKRKGTIGKRVTMKLVSCVETAGITLGAFGVFLMNSTLGGGRPDFACGLSPGLEPRPPSRERHEIVGMAVMYLGMLCILTKALRAPSQAEIDVKIANATLDIVKARRALRTIDLLRADRAEAANFRREVVDPISSTRGFRLPAPREVHTEPFGDDES